MAKKGHISLAGKPQITATGFENYVRTCMDKRKDNRVEQEHSTESFLMYFICCFEQHFE